jgi:CheY-like chemotaxis protein
VSVVVSDTGVGMDAETLAKVFDPFFTTKEAGRGTGLGLYMAYRVIERHGGTIDIASRKGEGTTVEIVLPAAEAAVEGEREQQGAEAGRGSGTVLLADDEEVMREVAAEMLRGLGYKVVTASDGRRAVNAVRSARESFVAAILDVAMPVMSGWEAAGAIRSIKPSLPIVITSGHDLETATNDTQGLADACLKKPYRVENLRQVLESLTARRSSAKA